MKNCSLNGGMLVNTECDVLFAFDDLSIEAIRGVKLEMMRPEKYPGNPILDRLSQNSKSPQTR